MPESKNTYAVAVETSGRIGSVAIGHNEKVLFESEFSGFMRHSAELFDTLETLLRQVGIRPRQIDQLSITAGPGSFTGIRIAVTLAKMLSFAVGTRIVAVDTLDVLAHQAFSKTPEAAPRRIVPLLDAKQNRFFTAVYERTGADCQKIHPSSLLYPEQLLALINKDNTPVGLLGEGLVYYADRFASPLTTPLDRSLWTPSAAGVLAVGHKMAQQGHFADIYTLVPTYIRKPDAVEKRENAG